MGCSNSSPGSASKAKKSGHKRSGTSETSSSKQSNSVEGDDSYKRQDTKKLYAKFIKKGRPDQDYTVDTVMESTEYGNVYIGKHNDKK